MGRRARNPIQIVQPVSSKKQLLRKEDVCAFLGGISIQSLDQIRTDKEQRFPQPLQILGQTPMWSVDQLERYIARREKEVEALSA